MSLYGALFGGVSGLRAQGAKIGVVSDNIANVNTVGYKESQALFETLVVNSSSTVSYTTGGVRGESRMKVDKQGLLLSTEAPTDIAISGQGFFTVNAQIDGSGSPLYTRAGSFRQDSVGNFVNAAGFYLQGWPLDRDGNLPGEGTNLNTTSFANLDSLETVNIESASGVAQATTTVEIGANLDAGEVVFPGKSLASTMDSNNTLNFNIDAETIIVPSEYNLAGANDIARGDTLEVVTGNGLNYDYEYGGFVIGRDITTATSAANVGDGLQNNDRLLDGAAGTLANTQFVADSANTFVVTINNHGLVTGDSITITGSAGVSVPDGAYTVTSLTANTFQITVPAHGIAIAASPAGAEFAAATLDYDPYDTGGNIFDANSATEAFFGVTGTTRFSTAALTFSITRGGDTHTFTYTASSPNTIAGQFNNLNTLAEAINEVNGLSGRVASGRLVVSAEDANEALTFANGENPLGTFSATQTGIDWITELDLTDVSQGSRRWNNMNGLAALVNADDGVTAVVSNALSNASIEIRVDDPLDTINIRDLQDSTLIDLTAVPAMTYSATSATGAAGEDIVVTVDFGAATTFSTTFGLTAGDIIDLQNENAVPIAALGLPAGFPNVAGRSLINSNAQIVVSNVNEAAGTFDFTIPGAVYNSAGYPVGPTVSVAGTATGTISVIGEGNQGSLVTELFAATTDTVADPNIGSLNATTYAAAGPQATGILGPEYDSSGVVGQNMASGNITAQFSRNVRVFDALGAGHDLRYSYIKIDENKWAVEVHAIPSTDVSTSLTDGQVAVGTITFNGDGSLRSVSSGLTGEISVVWTNGAIPSAITLDWGTAGQPFGTTGATTIGDTDGLSQFDADYNVSFVNQNGAPVGELVSVTIDEDGFVIASYSNGETQNLYKLPIAEFANPNGLRAITGNVFSETRDSGTVNLREAGTNGVGDVVGAALEQSNVELSEQLTDMIVAQRAYQSNTRVISTTDDLLEQLNNL